MSATALILVIVLAGIVTVVGSILLFRLHAFLALVLGALVVALLTPRMNLEIFAVEDAAVKSEAVANLGLLIEVGPKSSPEGAVWLVLRQPEADEPYEQHARLNAAHVEDVAEETPPEGEPEKKIKVVLPWTDEYAADDYRKTDLVIAPDEFVSAQKQSFTTIGARLAAAFGSTAGKIGIIIAMASIIGKCLLDSGAADRIVRSALSTVGEKRAPQAFIFSGFLLAIPVFFDTVFYLMIPLGKAMRLRTGKNYLLYVISIVAGGTMAHSLVPPTPGPLFVAEELSVNIGLMILAGCGVGLFTSTVGFLYAHWMNRISELPLRDTPDISLDDLETLSNRDESTLPPLGLSVLPILLPVFLIAGYTIVKPFLPGDPTAVTILIETLGDKNIALVIAAMIAVGILIKQSDLTKDEFAASMQSALAGAGVIILITSAGGAFGQMLKMTGVATLVRELPVHSPTVVLLLAFLITAAIRTAQGSSTVAMITAVGLFAPLVGSGALGVHPVYIALAIGCGSKPIAWMNDSGFWVITRMSGMTEQEGLKYITPLSITMGITGLVVVLAAAAVYPGV
jgi:GntP family gluconate:H+ symporter